MSFLLSLLVKTTAVLTDQKLPETSIMTRGLSPAMAAMLTWHPPQAARLMKSIKRPQSKNLFNKRGRQKKYLRTRGARHSDHYRWVISLQVMVNVFATVLDGNQISFCKNLPDNSTRISSYFATFSLTLSYHFWTTCLKEFLCLTSNQDWW